MKAGKLRQVVSVERQDLAVDEFGERVDTWVKLFDGRASIEPISGREYMTQSGAHSEVTTKLRIRYDDTRGTVEPKDRVVHGAIVYDIISVININERDRELVLMAKRGGSND